MPAPINTQSGFYSRSISQFDGLRGQLNTLQSQIATGVRLERSSDDPAAASRLRSLAREDRLEQVFAENADLLELDVSAASDALTGINNLLIRARELALAAGNDTLGDPERAAIATEIEQLGEELFARANTTGLDGEALFAGESGGRAYARDAAGLVSYIGSAQSGSLFVGAGAEIERGLTGPEFLELDVGGGPTDAFALLGGLAAALQGGAADPAAAARDAVIGIDAALDSSTRGQTILGARLAWIESIQQAQSDRSFSRAEQQADVGGVELTDAIAQLQQTLTVLEASQASFARLSSLSLFNAI